MLVQTICMSMIFFLSQSKSFVASDVLGGLFTFQIDIGRSRTTVTITAPISQFTSCGIGFGSSYQMNGVYAVIYDDYGITERILGGNGNRQGILLGINTHWMLDNRVTNDGYGNTLIQISRANVIDCSPYSCFQFDSSATSLPIIYAHGLRTVFTFHRNTRSGQLLAADKTSL